MSALDLVNELRLRFGFWIHLSKEEKEGYAKLHYVAIYLATGRLATPFERRHIG